MSQNPGTGDPRFENTRRESLFDDDSSEETVSDKPVGFNRPGGLTRPDRATVGPEPVVATANRSNDAAAGSSAAPRTDDSQTVFVDENESESKTRSELLADPAPDRGAYDLGEIDPGTPNRVGDDARDEKRFGISLGIRLVLATALIAMFTGALGAALDVDFFAAFPWTILGGLLFLVTDALMTRFERSHGVRKELL